MEVDREMFKDMCNILRHNWDVVLPFVVGLVIAVLIGKKFSSDWNVRTKFSSTYVKLSKTIYTFYDKIENVHTTGLALMLWKSNSNFLNYMFLVVGCFACSCSFFLLTLQSFL